MKNIKLLEVLNFIDDKIVEQAVEIDNYNKLKEIKQLEKKKNNSRILKYLSIFASGIAVFIFGFIMINMNELNNNEIQAPMSYVETKNIKELEKFINKDLSKYKIKAIQTMNIYKDSKMIEIIYNDDSIIRISDDNSDNSGISGANLKEEKMINNKKIRIYELDSDVKIVYAFWMDENNNSYSYIAGESENIINVLEGIV